MTSPGPKPADSEIDVYGLTHPGRVRAENQDHFLVCQLKKQIQVYFTNLPEVASAPEADRSSADAERLAFLMMVADGVGGSSRGGEASRLALEAVTRYVTESIHSYYASADAPDDEAFSYALEAAATRCHEDLLRRAGADADHKHMATTLTLFIGVWPKAYLVQIGDSRYYLLKHGQLVQISRDQTMAQDLIDQGVFTPTEGSKTRWAHVLSSAIGGPKATPVVTRIDNDRSYVHLLCSDGLTKHVTDERIADCLRSMSSAKQACERLLQGALDGGGSDNVTIIIGRTPS